nr:MULTISPECIES: CxxH/CxxC protein [unclassified Exiguobacterium]
MKRRRRPVDKYVCLEHVELALDEVVDETEEYPILEEVNSEKTVTCEYCDQPATYLVSSKK